MIEKEPNGLVQYIIYFWKEQFKYVYNLFFIKPILKNKLSTIYEENEISYNNDAKECLKHS